VAVGFEFGEADELFGNVCDNNESTQESFGPGEGVDVIGGPSLNAREIRSGQSL
jgi:hypothetical protein